MADSEGAEAGGKPLSTATFIMILLALTVVAGAIGFFGGMQIVSGIEQPPQSKEEEEEPRSPSLIQNVNAANVKVLTPIVTNLAGTPRAWIRIESSLVFRDEVPDDAEVLAARISEDIVAFLRTVTPQQIEGASGFQHLCEDLNDRVRVRSDGRVQELIIQGLIVE